MVMHTKFPGWVKKKVLITPLYTETRRILHGFGLNTVCEHARCPNIYECYGKSYATFMILGSVCTRNCTFCSVQKGRPEPVDFEEPGKIAEAAKELGLKYIVLTSVTRDDLADGGAGHFAACVCAIRNRLPDSRVEVLIPDFQGNKRNLEKVLASRPAVIGHNLETVRSLYPAVRPLADYQTSIEILKWSKQAGFLVKSGIMVGLGETHEEIMEVMKDLRSIDCDFFVIGQYLQPAKESYPVKKFVSPEKFNEYKKIGETLGFKKVFSGTFCRSSYMAEQAFS